MPTAPKPHELILIEGKSHRTKAEIAQKKKAAESLITGESFSEKADVKNNKIAHKEFSRLRKLYEAIKKNDALVENAINRYCLLYSECIEFQDKRELYHERTIKLDEKYNSGDSEIEMGEYYKLCIELQKTVISLDRQIMDKRKMMLAIEREMFMTLAAQLRSISPPEDKKINKDPMKALLERRINV